ncbi:hypothetical protein B1759_08890 [Rubrivirga sp. SAORIC476]|uniref:helix-turn-helix transcriptional regulator n=1 Tax=Rubrivirga sp. SAORIC476 TaxID=1961794 RepID=UPI000BD1EB9E|nr:helix-turn-helix transcriptional regulator [Rubrivirga sp. SAORIC476]PAP81427.1 hypothetical protein B1759_08890 [Rubrivirga sp. SAORIC476]
MLSRSPDTAFPRLLRPSPAPWSPQANAGVPGRDGRATTRAADPGSEPPSVRATAPDARADGPTAGKPVAVLVGEARRLAPALADAFAVVLTPTAEAAQAAVAADVPGLVVSALRLPDADGLALTAALEADPRTRDVPVVLLSPRACHDRLVVALARGRPTPPDLPHLIADMVGVARERLGDPAFGAVELARAVGLSPRQLRRRVRDATGETPGAFLRRLRLEHAAALLAGGTRCVKEVAHRVGFRSVSGFRAAFRAAFGVAPSAFEGPAPDG